ncbi:hypothetical protein EDB83DRAFT_2526162 [Lactarius deliciosus]|nr:hypothetical protein EDB83DRAFT_2526162 [Lactarius deliciosus]
MTMANSSSSTLESTSDETGPSVGLEKIDVLPASFYASFLSQAAKRHTQRCTPAVRGLFLLEQTPGVILLFAGKPNAALFPLTGVQLTAPRMDGSSSEDVELKVDDEVFAMGLQCAPTNGIPPMVEWLTEFQELEQGRRRLKEGWRVSVTAGSQDAIHKASLFSECTIPTASCRFLSDSDRHVQAVHALVNPGDPVLIEKPVYAGVILMFETLLCEMTEVETDANGLVSRPLQNELLDISREHNILILEYSRPPFRSNDNLYSQTIHTAAYPVVLHARGSTGDRSVGRVPHFDSFSKIMLASASTSVFVTGPPPLLDAMDRHTATTNLQASSFAPAVVPRDRDGFLTHARKVADFYRAKRDMFEAAMRLHLHGARGMERPKRQECFSGIAF